MRYIFIILLNIIITANVFAAASLDETMSWGAAAAAATGVETATADERIVMAQHIQRLATNNILWLEGFKASTDESTVKATLMSRGFITPESLNKALDRFKKSIVHGQNTWINIRRYAATWEGDPIATDPLKLLINSILTRIPNCEWLNHAYKVRARAPDELEKVLLNNNEIQRKDFENILQMVLPFTDPIYQNDCALYHPRFNSKFNVPKEKRKFLILNEDHGTVEIHNGLGEYMPIPLDPLPSFSIIQDVAEGPDDLPYVKVILPSGLVIIRDGREKSELIAELENLHKVAAEVKAKAAEKARASREALAAHEKALAELEAEIAKEEAAAGGKKSRSSKQLKKGKAAGATKDGSTAAAVVSEDSSLVKAAAGGVGRAIVVGIAYATPPISTSLIVDGAGAGAGGVSDGDGTGFISAPFATAEAAAGAGGVSDGDGRLSSAYKAKTLALAYSSPMARPPLSSYATYASASRAATSMDRGDKAMLANLLKVNGDGRFGPIQKANAYNWHQLELLLTHMGFTKTDAYEFTYNGNSIKLHYVHWSKHALDDKLLKIMFEKLANIGLTKEVLMRILDITSSSGGGKA